MSDKQQVWATLAQLIQRVEQGLPGAEEAFQQEVRKLGKAQMKANLLAEQQAQLWQELVAQVEAQQAQQAQAFALLKEQQTAADHHSLLLALMPVLDGIEDALNNGRQFLRTQPQTAEWHTLKGWLVGLRLVQEHLLGVMETHGVTPIPTLGQPFDPYWHKAVGVRRAENGTRPNTIAAEERKGYKNSHGVLRYAEVTVFK